MIIDGKKLANILLDEAKILIQEIDHRPRLAMVYIDYDQRSREYLEMKQKVAGYIGIESTITKFDEDITTQQLRKKIVNISKKESNDGVIIELPFPKHINTQYVLNGMDPKKDPDVLSQRNQGAFFVGRCDILPPSVDTLRIICEYHDIDLSGKECVVFGYGILIGKPIAHWLAMNGATVIIVNEHTPDQKRITQNADIIIAGANKSHIITADMIKDGAVVVDYGYERIWDRLVGNVVFDEVKDKASLITSVPGGVGPIGIASAMRNLVMLMK